MSMPAIDIDAMTPEERVKLIGDLWDSLPKGQVVLSNTERAELDRRLADLDADIAAGRPLGSTWEDVRERIASRRNTK